MVEDKMTILNYPTFTNPVPEISKPLGRLAGNLLDGVDIFFEKIRFVLKTFLIAKRKRPL